MNTVRLNPSFSWKGRWTGPAGTMKAQRGNRIMHQAVSFVGRSQESGVETRVMTAICVTSFSVLLTYTFST